MMHKRRTWVVTDLEAESDEDRGRLMWKLAQKLIGHSWTLCSGWKLGGYLFLNDATCEDGAFEVAVIREADLRQVESITFGWITDPITAVAYVRDCIHGKYDAEAWASGIGPANLHTPAEHRATYCRLCA